jgi:hypothetical protein
MKPLKEDIKGCGRSLRPRVLQNIDLQRDESDKIAGFRKCQKACALCMNIEDSSVVITKVPEVFWKNVQSSVKTALCSLEIPTSSCRSANVVYLCGCVACGAYYVGETGRSLNVRCSKHRLQRDDLKKHEEDGLQKGWSEVRKHFVENNHEGSFWVAPLEVLAEAAGSVRKDREQHFIQKLQPALNIRLKHQPGRKSGTKAGLASNPCGIVRRSARLQQSTFARDT